MPVRANFVHGSQRYVASPRTVNEQQKDFPEPPGQWGMSCFGVTLEGGGKAEKKSQTTATNTGKET